MTETKNNYLEGFKQWAKDRFPMANVLSGFLAYFTVSLLASHFSPDHSLKFSFLHLLGAIALTCHFLFLRILDEHKDYEKDCINHPERALQKGMISLGDLKVLAVLCLVIEYLWAFRVDKGWGVSCTLLSFVLAYSLLMAKEFFIGPWLEKKLPLYAFLHMLVSPLMMTWVYLSMQKNYAIDFGLWGLLLLSLLSGFVYELTRKTRGPQEESETLDSYTKIWGVQACVILINVLNFMLFITYLVMMNNISPSYLLLHLSLVMLSFLLFGATTYKFWSSPSLEARKKNEACYGLQMLMIYLSLIIACWP